MVGEPSLQPTGWVRFAIANGIKGGSIVAFSFHRNGEDLDIDVYVLAR